jgi:HK97 family phage major capsid protein
MDTTLQREFKRLADDIESREKKIRSLQTQVDAIDTKLAERHVGSGSGDGSRELRQNLEENADVMRLLRDKKGGPAVITVASELLERKAVLTESGVGFATSGVISADRIAGIVTEARQRLTIRNLLTSRPTTSALIDFVRVSSPLLKASPQSEGELKHENTVTFTTTSEKTKTIATTIPASRQILDDLDELMNFLRTGLAYAVDLEEELQILSGDATGENLNGLLTQASPFDTGLLVPYVSTGWTRIDQIGLAIQQIVTSKELTPDFIVLHPVDFWGLRLLKTEDGAYLLGSPLQPAPTSLFGLRPLVTTSISVGTFLLGNSSPIAAELRDRMQIVVEVSTQHSDFFVRNQVMLRAEKRVALIVFRPGSFCTGSFSSSP